MKCFITVDDSKTHTRICFWSKRPNLQGNRWHGEGFFKLMSPFMFFKLYGFRLKAGEIKEIFNYANE